MRTFVILIYNICFLSLIFGYKSDNTEKISISHEKFVLSNGLNVILHEDHSIPMVSINIWYHVGSKNEKAGKTGLAHLFEHLMFEGSKHHDANFAEPLEKIGGIDNGSTNTDRTNYWVNVPSNELELALWLEADRMGFLLDVMNQEKLDNQRDIVKNERHQRYVNQPYGKAWEIMPMMMFPSEHPYHWIPIGSMKDLSTASLDDISNFFRKYYIPNNASLCIAGDIDPDKTLEYVHKYFGSIPSGKPIDRMEIQTVELDGIIRKTAIDNVSLPKLYYGWHTPALYQPGDAEMDHLANILASSKVSRLYKTLVYEMKIAHDVEAFQWSREIGSTFHIVVTAKENSSLDEIEKIVDKEINKILKLGVSQKELEQSKIQWESRFIRGLENIGGFGGKADILNAYNIMLGNPDMFNWDLDRYMNVGIQDIKNISKKYLDMNKRAVLRILPPSTMIAAKDTIDRNIVPSPDGDITFFPPKIQREELSNGLELMLIENNNLPLIEATLIIKSGWTSDPINRPGACALTADLLDEGTKRNDAMDIAEESRNLGINIGTSSYFDATFVSFNSLKKNFGQSLDLMADLVMNATFPEKELEHKKQEYLDRIQQENKEPLTAAIKQYYHLLYGDEHPYGQSYTGTGTKESINALRRKDLVDFYNNNYFSNNATILIVGDIGLKEAKMKAEQHLNRWQPGIINNYIAHDPIPRENTEIFLIDKPDASQSVIVMGNLGIKRNAKDYLSTNVMNTAFGDQFTSRLNMNLREEKGYTYEAGSFFSSRKGIGPFGCYAPVETKYTIATIKEMLKELNDLVDSRPLSNKEVENAKNNLINTFPGRFESLAGISDEAADLIMYDLSDYTWELYTDNIKNISGMMATQAAKDHIHPDRLLIVIVGDRKLLEDDLYNLNLGKIRFLDINGNPTY